MEELRLYRSEPEGQQVLDFLIKTMRLLSEFAVVEQLSKIQEPRFYDALQ